MRRYFWRARETDPARADEALGILAKLFEVERDTAHIPMPERTGERARRAAPILAIFDAWIERVRLAVEPRTPLAAALTYYDNQRDGLRCFLDDGWLRIDNNLCEQQLRILVVDRSLCTLSLSARNRESAVVPRNARRPTRALPAAA